MAEIKYDSDSYNKDAYKMDGFDQEGYDRDGFGWNGFNREGIHLFTGTKFDSEGYDAKKRDKNGFDKRGIHYKILYGFNRYGIHDVTGTKYDPSGFDINGCNYRGFLRNKIHSVTKSRYDPDGYDFFGCNNKGINRQGASEEIQEATVDPHRLGTDGEDPNGSSNGFDQNGIHYITGTKFDPSGLDVNGIDKNGLDREGFYENGLDVDGFDRNEIHHITGTKYDPSGLDVNRLDISGSRRDKRGFNKNEIHWKTSTKFDVDGYDLNGFDPLGYKICGYDKDEYDNKGFDKLGYDKLGYDNKGFDKLGYDRVGYDNEGFLSNGFNAAGIHKLTHTKYAPDGYDINGRDIESFNRYGVDNEGFKKDGFHYIHDIDRKGYDRNVFHRNGRTLAQNNAATLIAQARLNQHSFEAEFSKYDISCLWHITHIDNMRSILERGILNHYDAHRFNRADISNAEVQRWREEEEPCFNRKIHAYAPLYIQPRNPMLFVSRQHNGLCLVEVSLSALQENDFIITDGNAASHDTKFYSSIRYLDELPWNVLQADRWDNLIDGKRKRCAEVLVYPKVLPEHIGTIHCNSDNIVNDISSLGHDALLSKELFF